MLLQTLQRTTEGRHHVVNRQALNGLDETGIADMPTWAALLGPELRPASGSPATGTGEAPAAAHYAAQPTVPQPPAAAPAWDSLFAAGANGAQESASNGSAGGPGSATTTAGQQPAGQVALPHRPPPSAAPPPSRWPVVRMDDGGREVHWLQVGCAGPVSFDVCVTYTCTMTEWRLQPYETNSFQCSGEAPPLVAIAVRAGACGVLLRRGRDDVVAIWHGH